MDLLHGIALITVVHLLAAASPGPDFVMVSQQTLCNGKKAGMLCSIGIALGLSVHITYSALGLAAVIANSTTALTIIKMLGGTYLIYLGTMCIRSKAGTDKEVGVTADNTNKLSISKTITKGFLCNVLNPKAPIYFISLFTIVLSPNLPIHFLIIYGLWIMFLQFAWFAFVVTILSSPPVAKRFNKYSHYIDRTLGGAMILLGLKVLLSKNG